MFINFCIRSQTSGFLSNILRVHSKIFVSSLSLFDLVHLTTCQATLVRELVGPRNSIHLYLGAPQIGIPQVGTNRHRHGSQRITPMPMIRTTSHKAPMTPSTASRTTTMKIQDKEDAQEKDHGIMLSHLVVHRQAQTTLLRDCRCLLRPLANRGKG